MNLKDLIQKKLALENSNIVFNESMKKYTSFKVGGLAEVLIKVKTVEDLKKILIFAKENNVKLTIIGNGSNILVLDEGIEGIVLKIELKKLEITELENKDEIEVKVGAGNKNIEISQVLLKHEIEGFEEISGIPGTIGGAVRMNAGAHGKEIKDIIKEVIAIDYNGNIKHLKNEEMKFEYRNSILSKEKLIILEAILKLNKGNKDKIQSKINEYKRWRRENQPLEYPNAGSTFKRGEDFITAKLIDECNLRGYSIGGAEVSLKHAGFIVNKGNATAKDIIELTNYIKEKVYEKFQKKIELEIEVIDNK